MIKSIDELPVGLEGEVKLPIPAQFRRGLLRDYERWSIESAVANLKGIARRTGLNDWSGLKILDYGCGVKFTQALLQFDVDFECYVGMDVYAELIDFLAAGVKDPRFQFHAVNFYNQMYNRKGVPMTVDSVLPGEVKQYDLITLQSVFTHFTPDDVLTMLHVLRAHAAKDARMLFTCFIDNDMEESFSDSVPDQPLMKAVYKEQSLREMLAASSWGVESLNPPSYMMQDHFVCKPI